MLNVYYFGENNSSHNLATEYMISPLSLRSERDGTPRYAIDPRYAPIEGIDHRYKLLVVNYMTNSPMMNDTIEETKKFADYQCGISSPVSINMGVYSQQSDDTSTSTGTGATLCGDIDAYIKSIKENLGVRSKFSISGNGSEEGGGMFKYDNLLSKLLPKLLKFRSVGQFPLLFPKMKQQFNADLRKSITSSPDAASSSSDESLPVSTVLVASSSQVERWAEEYTCVICLEIMVEPAGFMCGHSGCLPCLERVTSCPVCRTPVPETAQLAINLSLRHAIGHILGSHPEYQRRKRAVDDALKSREAVWDSPRHGIEYVDAFEPTGTGKYVRSAMGNVTASLPTMVPDLHSHATLSSGRFKYQASALSIPTWYCPDLVSPSLFSGEVDPDAKSPIDCITDNMLRTIMRRAALMAETDESVKEVRKLMTDFVSTVTRSVTTTSNVTTSSNDLSGGFVVSAEHMRTAVESSHGIAVYGYGGHGGIQHVFIEPVRNVLQQIHPDLRMTPVGFSICNDIIVDLLQRFVKRAITHNDELLPPDNGPGKLHVFNVEHVQGKVMYPIAIEVSASDTLEDNAIGTVLRASSFILAVPDLMDNDLRVHGIAEGEKAMNKFISNEVLFRSVEDFNVHSMHDLALLQFRPTDIALLAYKLCSVTLTTNASVYLAAICEYVIAEILELAGNATHDGGMAEITGRMLMAGIRLDFELEALFHHGVERDAGVLPNIPEYSNRGLTHPNIPARTAHKELLQSLIKGAPRGIIIDPLTGCHVGGKNLTCVEELDVACAACAADRATMAMELLSEEQRQIVSDAALTPVLPTDIIATIMRLQKLSSHIIDWSCFTRFLYHVSNDTCAAEVIYTAEAISILLTAVENWLHNRCVRAYQAANIAQRRIVYQEDFDASVSDRDIATPNTASFTNSEGLNARPIWGAIGRNGGNNDIDEDEEDEDEDEEDEEDEEEDPYYGLGYGEDGFNSDSDYDQYDDLL